MICDKISYQTKREANDAVVSLKASKRKGEYSVYSCDRCDCFHVSTFTKRKLHNIGKKANKYPIKVEDFQRKEPIPTGKKKKEKK